MSVVRYYLSGVFGILSDSADGLDRLKECYSLENSDLHLTTNNYIGWFKTHTCLVPQVFQIYSNRNSKKKFIERENFKSNNIEHFLEWIRSKMLKYNEIDIKVYDIRYWIWLIDVISCGDFQLKGDPTKTSVKAVFILGNCKITFSQIQAILAEKEKKIYSLFLSKNNSRKVNELLARLSYVHPIEFLDGNFKYFCLKDKIYREEPLTNIYEALSLMNNSLKCCLREFIQVKNKLVASLDTKNLRTGLKLGSLSEFIVFRGNWDNKWNQNLNNFRLEIPEADYSLYGELANWGGLALLFGAPQILEGNIVKIDINSAYGSAMEYLPSAVGIPVKMQKDDICFVECKIKSFKFKENIIKGCTNYANLLRLGEEMGGGHVYILEDYLKLLEKIGNIEYIVLGKRYHRRIDPNLKTPLSVLNNISQSCPIQKKYVKHIITRMYGKLCQSAYEGPYVSRIAGSFISQKIQMKVLNTMVNLSKSCQDIKFGLVVTDGITFQTKSDNWRNCLDIGNKIGQWRVEVEKGEMLIIKRFGVYLLMKAKGSYIVKSSADNSISLIEVLLRQADMDSLKDYYLKECPSRFTILRCCEGRQGFTLLPFYKYCDNFSGDGKIYDFVTRKIWQ